MRLRKQKSRKAQVTDLAIDYLKLKAAGKAAKGAGTAVKGAGKTAKGAAVVVSAGVAAIVATKVVKGRHGSAQAAT
jgi:hypothetical protein